MCRSQTVPKGLPCSAGARMFMWFQNAAAPTHAVTRSMNATQALHVVPLHALIRPARGLTWTPAMLRLYFDSAVPVPNTKGCCVNGQLSLYKRCRPPGRCHEPTAGGAAALDTTQEDAHQTDFENCSIYVLMHVSDSSGCANTTCDVRIPLYSTHGAFTNHYVMGCFQVQAWLGVFSALLTTSNNIKGRDRCVLRCARVRSK